MSPHKRALFLVFGLGKDRYALKASKIVEVLPMLEMKRLPHAPKGVAGVFMYHGVPVPAVDLSEVTLGAPAPRLLQSGIKIQGAPYLGPVLTDPTGPIQLFYEEHLLTEPVQQLILNPTAIANIAPPNSDGGPGLIEEMAGKVEYGGTPPLP